MTTTRARGIRTAGLVLVGALALSACTASPDAEEGTTPLGLEQGRVTHPVQEWHETDETTTLGSSDEEIPSDDEIPQKLHVGRIQPIGEDQIVIMGSGWGLEITSAAVDPATGAVTALFATGPGIWDPVLHPFVGATSDDPALLAQEVWRPRGSRGAADFTISTYSGNLLEPDEILTPDYTRPHSRWGSSAVTDDGRFFAFWDDAFFGIRVYDLENGTETGALQLTGCGPFTWAVEHRVYSVCEDKRQLLELTIADDGSIEETGREAVLPGDFVSNRHASMAHDAGTALLVSANGDVYVLDVSDGLPAASVTPVGNAGQDSGRFDQAIINNPATSLVISYTDSAIHPHSKDGGDEVKLILSDPATFRTLATLELEGMKLTSIDGVGYSVDGATLYVVGTGAEDATEIVGFDALTGAETSRSTLEGFTDSPSRIITPQVIG
ncbi:hypothetical protein [Microbacterium sp. No. 7]|uniref:hypothetical protein n=1 Tax=Microbacterium sp. No. 7 TaxID=1714373 RepID=UPI0006D038B8|nr:hypothetical protein [Microbacterium sp. No. 7]ALJ21596.1 hypothetical protein AOA12_17535 [Microbacterium sp. No. 7]